MTEDIPVDLAVDPRERIKDRISAVVAAIRDDTRLYAEFPLMAIGPMDKLTISLDLDVLGALLHFDRDGAIEEAVERAASIVREQLSRFELVGAAPEQPWWRPGRGGERG